VVPTAQGATTPDTAGAEVAGIGETRDTDPDVMPRIFRPPWAALLKRVFMTNALKCPKCQGRMKILAAITKPEAIREILAHLGIPSEAPRCTSARPPPQAELAGTSDLAEVDSADPPSPEW
jgi:hypothetical protein